MTFIKTTEQESLYNDLDRMDTDEILFSMNQEDAKVAEVIKNQIPVIKDFVDALYKRMSLGGRLFYLGAGTSGRLGIVDASECPPTYGVAHGMVVKLADRILLLGSHEDPTRVVNHVERYIIREDAQPRDLSAERDLVLLDGEPALRLVSEYSGGTAPNIQHAIQIQLAAVSAMLFPLPLRSHVLRRH